MAVFQAAEVTAKPVYEIDQLMADEHIQARGVIVEAPDEEAGSVLMHNMIPRLFGDAREGCVIPRRSWGSTRVRCCEGSAIRPHGLRHWRRMGS